MTIGTRSQFRRAINRARELKGWERVTALGRGRYDVLGRAGDAYTVAVDGDGEYECSCPSGARGGACWHQGSVYLTLAQRAAFRPLATTATARSIPDLAPRVDPVTRRPNGRGIGFSPADLGDDDDLPTLGELLAAVGGGRR